MLCEVCLSIDSSKLFPPLGTTSRFPHHNSYGAITAAADSGCAFCNAIVGAVSSADPDRKQALKDGYLSRLQFLLRSINKGSKKGAAEHAGYNEVWVICGAESIAKFDLFVQRDAPSALRDIITGRPTYHDPGSAEVVKIMESWLESCLGSHSMCSADFKFILPTRLIDVGTSDQSPRLVHTTEISVDHLDKRVSPYIALSHRWGGSQPLTTTIETLKDRLAAIPVDQLPKTFRDAVNITRLLGQKYLWIDSLCIIQDSTEDWAHEAAQMVDIYQQSLFTISADSASNCDAGFLKVRDLSFSPVALPFKATNNAGPAEFFVRPHFDDWESCVSGDLSALSTRAWCLQESMLSKRTMHFSHQQVLWSCCTSSVAEGSIAPVSAPRGRRSRDWDWTNNKRFLQVTDTRAGADDDTTRQLLYLRWHAVLRDYTTRHLTVASDMFPALSGLASAFGSKLHNDQYIAGLWKKDLLRGLLWASDDSGYARYAEASEAWRAPSWSWASIVGPLRLMRMDILVDPRLKVIDVAIDHKESMNMYGKVLSGRLEVEGKWMDAKAWGPEFDEKWWEPSYVTNPKGEDGYISVEYDVTWNETAEAVIEERRRHGLKMVVLQVARWAEEDETAAHPGDLWALLLEQVHESDTWRRRGIGHFFQERREWVDGWETGRFSIV